jgi:ParB family chromosome partitioning protein
MTNIQKIPDIPCSRVDPDAIECPGPYCMSFGFDLDPLIRSIKKIGLVNHPLVIENSRGGLTVVAGYRRIQALQYLKHDKIPCRILSGSQLSPLECLRINLYDNLAARALNAVEKAMILSRLAAWLPRSEILDHYMALLGLPRHEPTFIFFQRLEQELDTEIKEYLAKGRVSLQVAKGFLDMDHQFRRPVFDLLSNLKLNINQQKQFIEYIVDISHENDSAISGLFNETEFMRICSDKGMNTPQKARAVLAFLRTRRFPALAGAEDAFKKRVSRLNLPDGVRIKAPPYFEAALYRLEVLFKDGIELTEKIESLSRNKGLADLDNSWERSE